jgi:hypothetical protein
LRVTRSGVGQCVFAACCRVEAIDKLAKQNAQEGKWHAGTNGCDNAYDQESNVNTAGRRVKQKLNKSNLLLPPLGEVSTITPDQPVKTGIFGLQLAARLLSS